MSFLSAWGKKHLNKKQELKQDHHSELNRLVKKFAEKKSENIKKIKKKFFFLHMLTVWSVWFQKALKKLKKNYFYSGN